MDALYHRCAGLDVHAKTIVVCALWGEEDHIQKEIETLSTFTKNLFRLLKWLEDREITHLAMESTGVYWKPVFNILEDYFDITLAVNVKIRMHNFDCIVMYKNDFMDNYVIKWWIVIT
ncbi:MULTISPECIES: transposase [unclassified Anoxybacillus]|uniref:IS110 family transposase n=1 Tax=unclassified Anoxybacillus TaxID=2639704 RepID=UPI002106D05F|nr:MULTISPECIES: transposase [unclassified Anoxybacillus]